MNVFVLSDPKSDAGKRLRRIIGATHLKGPVEYHETLSDLVVALTRPGKGRGIAILQVNDREEMESLISVQEWLEDLKIIVVLPDDQPDIIARAHLLYPRFVAFSNGDLTHVGSVLEKMTKSLT